MFRKWPADILPSASLQFPGKKLFKSVLKVDFGITTIFLALSV